MMVRVKMELEFELKNKKEINIIAVKGEKRHLVGNIFTPSGSGHTIKNAIQVCGASEIFDFWGCAVFGKLDDKLSVVARLDGRSPEHIQMKDIQLKFDWETEPHNTQHSSMDGDDCLGCYNNPCTCERKFGSLTFNEVIEGKGKKSNNPYDVKRAQDINDLEEVKK